MPCGRDDRSRVGRNRRRMFYGLLALIFLLPILIFVGRQIMISMPGKSYRGDLPAAVPVFVKAAGAAADAVTSDSAVLVSVQAEIPNTHGTRMMKMTRFKLVIFFLQIRRTSLSRIDAASGWREIISDGFVLCVQESQ